MRILYIQGVRGIGFCHFFSKTVRDRGKVSEHDFHANSRYIFWCSPIRHKHYRYRDIDTNFHFFYGKGVQNLAHSIDLLILSKKCSHAFCPISYRFSRKTRGTTCEETQKTFSAHLFFRVLLKNG